MSDRKDVFGSEVIASWAPFGNELELREWLADTAYQDAGALRRQLLGRPELETPPFDVYPENRPNADGIVMRGFVVGLMNNRDIESYMATWLRQEGLRAMDLKDPQRPIAITRVALNDAGGIVFRLFQFGIAPEGRVMETGDQYYPYGEPGFKEAPDTEDVARACALLRDADSSLNAI